MREILFRGKQEEGRWVEGAYFKHDTVKVCFSSDDPKTRHLIIQDGFCDWGFEPPIHCVDVDPNTVGQFTGLTDKNGKKIFEGDVLLVSDTDTAIVEYDETAAMFMAVFGYTDSDYTSLCNQYPDIKIIGNIHDNPELIGGGEGG